MVRKTNAQSAYFSRVKYREALHPVVKAYASPKLEYVLKTIALQKDAKILDVGCGNGVFSYHLRKHFQCIVGLDLSSHLLVRNAYALRVCGDGAELPFADSSFDLVFEANLLHHIADRERVISSMRRVSRRYVVMIEPNRLNPLMVAFSLAVHEERGVLRSSKRALTALAEKMKLNCISAMTTGMISQNNTPAFLVPLLRRFDREISWGEYVVLVAER